MTICIRSGTRCPSDVRSTFRCWRSAQCGSRTNTITEDTKMLPTVQTRILSTEQGGHEFSPALGHDLERWMQRDLARHLLTGAENCAGGKVTAADFTKLFTLLQTCLGNWDRIARPN